MVYIIPLFLLMKQIVIFGLRLQIPSGACSAHPWHSRRLDQEQLGIAVDDKANGIFHRNTTLVTIEQLIL